MGEGTKTEIRTGKDSQSNTKSKSLAVERRKKMAKEVESGGVETKEDERSTKKMGIEKPAARLVDLTN